MEKINELEIAIQEAKEYANVLENMVMNFTDCGRVPCSDDYFQMISILEKWKKTQIKIKCLESLQQTIVSNAKQVV